MPEAPRAASYTTTRDTAVDERALINMREQPLEEPEVESVALGNPGRIGG